MGEQLVVALIGSGSILAIGVAIGKSLTTRRDLTALDQKVHKLSNRLQPYPEKPDDVYARKDVVGAELTHIRETVERIEATQSAMVNRLIGGV